MTSALEALSFNHRTAREVPGIVFKAVCIWEGQVGDGKEGKGWTPSNCSFGLNYTPRDKFAKISVLDKVYSDELMMVFIAPKWNYSHFKHLWKSVKILTFLPGLWHTAVQRCKLVWGEWPVCFLSRERFQGSRAQLIIQNNGIWVKFLCLPIVFLGVLADDVFLHWKPRDNLSWNEHPWFDFWFHQQLAGRLYLGHWPSLWLTFLPRCKSTCISEDQIEGCIDGVWSVLRTNQTHSRCSQIRNSSHWILLLHLFLRLGDKATQLGTVRGGTWTSVFRAWTLLPLPPQQVFQQQ